jgi:cystathionine gamma-synthase
MDFAMSARKNPTQLRLEAALRDLEGGLAALVFSSGMAASAAMLQTLRLGSHVIFSDHIYIHVRGLARDFLPAWGIESSNANLQDLNALAERSGQRQSAWIETPSNPLLQILDIASISRIARKAGAQPPMDSEKHGNTFWSCP